MLAVLVSGAVAQEPTLGDGPPPRTTVPWKARRFAQRTDTEILLNLEPSSRWEEGYPLYDVASRYPWFWAHRARRARAARVQVLPVTRTVAGALTLVAGIRPDATWDGAPLAFSIDGGPAWVEPPSPMLPPLPGVARR